MMIIFPAKLQVKFRGFYLKKIMFKLASNLVIRIKNVTMHLNLLNHPEYTKKPTKKIVDLFNTGNLIF